MLCLQTSVTPVHRNQVSRSSSVSKIFGIVGVLVCILQASVTPVVRNKFTRELCNVSVFNNMR